MDNVDRTISTAHEDAWGSIRLMLARVREEVTERQRGAEGDADILHARARAYARPRKEEDRAAVEEVLLIRLGTASYALPCSDIEEVLPLQNLVSLPYTPGSIIGISSHRGMLFVVMDPKRVLGIPGTNLTTMHRIVMLRHGRSMLGMLVDAVEGMCNIDLSTLRKVPELVGDERSRFFRGLTDDRALVLHSAALLDEFGPR